jgi:hypothetical protein
VSVWLAYADDREADRVTAVVVEADSEEEAIDAADEAMVLVGRGHVVMSVEEFELPLVLHLAAPPHSVFGEDAASGGPSPEGMAEPG